MLKFSGSPDENGNSIVVDKNSVKNIIKPKISLAEKNGLNLILSLLEFTP